MFPALTGGGTPGEQAETARTAIIIPHTALRLTRSATFIKKNKLSLISLKLYRILKIPS